MAASSLSDAQLSALKRILSQEPIKDHRLFIVSTAFEHRQSIGERGQLVTRTITQRPLPEWVGSADALGPYERTMLCHFLTGIEQLVIIRGGTGSGKSSILSFLSWFLNSDEIKGKQKGDGSTFDRLLSVIDLESLDKKFTEELDPRKHRETYHRYLAEVKAQVAQRLGQELLRNVPNGKDLHGLVGAAIARVSEFLTGVQTATYVLSQGLKECNDWNHDFSRTGQYLATTIDKIADPHFRLLIWLNLWSEASRSQPFALGKKPLVLAFDNIDQMASFLQREICIVLQQFFADTQGTGSAFRVVFMMRLASAVDKYYSLPGRYAISAHEPPDAVDVLATRSLAYLLEPDILNSDLTDTEKRELFERILVFYLNLIDTKGEMRRLLRGLVGTNLRLAHAHAMKWVASRSTTSLKVPFSLQYDRAHEDVLRDLAPNVFVKVVHATGRAIQILFDEFRVGPDMASVPQVDDGWHSRFVEALSEKIAYILHHSRLLLPIGGQPSDLRSKIGAAAGAQAAKVLISDSHEANDHRKRLLAYLINIFRDCPLFDEGVTSDLAHLIGTEAEQRLRDMVVERLKSFGRGDHELVSFLVELVVEAIEQSGATELHGEGSRLGLSIANRHRVDFEHLNGTIRGSRFAAARILLEGAASHADDDHRAVNLFGIDSSKISLAPLYLLYRVAERTAPHEDPDAVSYRRLATEASNLDKSGDFDDALRAFIRRDRRLVYSGVDDEARDVDAWKEDPDRTIHLTWSGARYYRDVLSTPTYLQWAYTGIQELRIKAGWREETDHSVAGRLGFVLASFRSLLSAEFEALERLARPHIADEGDTDRRHIVFRTVGFRACGPVADVFFRASPAFIEALRNSILGIARRNPMPHERARDGHDIDRLLELLTDWIKEFDVVMAKFRDLYGSIPQHWEEVFSFADRDKSGLLRDLALLHR